MSNTQTAAAALCPAAGRADRHRDGDLREARLARALHRQLRRRRSRRAVAREPGAAGVDISAARTVAGATNQFAVILVDARSGERTVLWDRHPALTMEPADVPREAVTSGRLLIVDCHETAGVDAGRALRARGRHPDHHRRRESAARESPICCSTSTRSSPPRTSRPR